MEKVGLHLTLINVSRSLADMPREVLKQPLETAIGIHTEDFEDFHMQENMHIVISVKDFRAIVTHAETLRNPISAYFSRPTRPLQFSYQNWGIHCEFTLMTSGDLRGATSTPNPNFISTRSTPSRQVSAVPAQSVTRSGSEMPPPARPRTSRPLGSQSQRPSFQDQVQTSAETEDADPDSLFVPLDGGDEDQAWDEPNYDREEEEMLGWDANDDPSASMRPTIRDINRKAEPPKTTRDTRDANQSQEAGLEPTQRLSQVSTMPKAFAITCRKRRCANFHSCTACLIERHPALSIWISVCLR